MSRRPALSLSLYLADRRVLLFGTGAGCEDRQKRLEDAGASVFCIKTSPWQKIADQENSSKKFFLVVANSESADNNREIAEWARRNSLLAYAHDQPEISDFAFPALSQRGVLQIAISTQGVAPALAAQFRRLLSTMLQTSGQSLDAIATELELSRKKFPPGEERMKLLKKLAARVRHVGSLTIADE